MFVKLFSVTHYIKDHQKLKPPKQTTTSNKSSHTLYQRSSETETSCVCVRTAILAVTHYIKDHQKLKPSAVLYFSKFFISHTLYQRSSETETYVRALHEAKPMYVTHYIKDHQKLKLQITPNIANTKKSHIISKIIRNWNSIHLYLCFWLLQVTHYIKDHQKLKQSMQEKELEARKVTHYIKDHQKLKHVWEKRHGSTVMSHIISKIIRNWNLQLRF